MEAGKKKVEWTGQSCEARMTAASALSPVV